MAVCFHLEGEEATALDGEMRTVHTPATAEFTEKRSRFIGVLQPAETASEAQAFLEDLRREHRDARHVCFAYRTADGTKFSDDGEPAGTAGQPLMQVLERNELQNCVLAVVRYFGGILLGAGGLLRAYSHTGALTVQAAQIVTMRQCKTYEIVCDYGAYGFVRPLLEQNGVLLDSDFGEAVTLVAALPPHEVEAVNAAIVEQSAGRFSGKVTGDCLIPFEEKNETKG